MHKTKKPSTAFIALRGARNDDEWVKLILCHGALRGVVDERMKQLRSWSYEHDDGHSVEDWAYLISERTENLSAGVPKKKAKQLLIEIGALAVAAIEAFERSSTKKRPPKRAKRL